MTALFRKKNKNFNEIEPALLTFRFLTTRDTSKQSDMQVGVR